MVLNLREDSARRLWIAKLVLFTGALVPLVFLGWSALNDQLGPNPVEMLQRKTGIWSLNFLMLTLAISPLRQLANLPWLIRLRRMLGLFAFFYGTLHLLSFTIFDHAMELAGIANDILERRFIAIGFAAWLLMLPLAASSSDWAIKTLGGQRWQALQRLVHVVISLAAIHFFWLSKGTALLWPIAYTFLIGLFFSWRIWKKITTERNGS